MENFCQRLFGIIMGTNVAPILADLYIAMLEQELETICKAKNINCPTFYKRFIDDGFGIFVGTKTEFITWINEFNAFRKEITIDKWNFGNSVNFMDLYVYKDKDFFKEGKLDISTYQKPCNKCIYLLGLDTPNR